LLNPYDDGDENIEEIDTTQRHICRNLTEMPDDETLQHACYDLNAAPRKKKTNSANNNGKISSLPKKPNTPSKILF
jgi:hypothetical protein